MKVNFSIDIQAMAQSVSLFYISGKNELHVVPMLSDGNTYWLVPPFQLFEDEVKYFAYLINDHCWFCRSDFGLFDFNGVPYNDINKPHLNKDDLVVEKSLFCKKFLEPDFEPYLETKVFTNMDTLFGFWCRVTNVKQDTMIYFQLLDPKFHIHFLHFEILKQSNKTNNSRDYYFGMQVNPTLTEGIWTSRIIVNHKIISENKAEYKIYKNSYNQSPFVNSTLIIDKKA
ncbi:hypothetical protein [Paenibacillus wynnii]|uniref:Uncharacterized protein n=1 Tax=Paenibacillus wynnii TaxID=268407 RepID=A0A098MAV3_9BACL|nr:hypothetical protein [Paenibacillus wynnii]KGE19679.1 hypothetical protein PWYN_10235 [Paenibacillus wynnii]